MNKNRKLFSAFVIFVIASVCFLSCSKGNVDEYGCFMEMDSALKNAKKKNQEILAIITLQGEDDYSSDFVQNVLSSQEFKNQILKNYSVLLMDFSQSTYQKTVVDPAASKSNQKKAQEFAEIVQKNSKTASLLNARSTPSFFILTKDQYFITELEYDDQITTYQGFKNLLDEQTDLIEKMHQMVDATKKGSKVEKITAIDNLFEVTDAAYRPFLIELIEQAIKLDSENESGLLSKYLLARADAKGSDLFLTGDSMGAVNTYLEACKDAYLEPSHKQQAYYMAAYILSMSGTDDYMTVLQYLQMAIDSDPENENTPAIQQTMDYLQQAVEQYKQSEGSNDDGGEN